MRELFIFIGLPNSGQEEFIKKHNILDFTLTPNQDVPEFNIYNKIKYKKDFNILYQKIQQRMNLGHSIFINFHHCSLQELRHYIELSKKNRYKITLIKFPVNLEKSYKSLFSKKQINYLHNKLKNFKHNLKEITPKKFKKYFKHKSYDISNAHNIYFFGDIQGCYKPLRLFFKHHKESHNNLYFFLGDYINKGNENHKVVQWLLNNYKKKNFIFLEGNHEKYLRNWSDGDPSEPEKFKKTKKQLESFNINKNKVSDFCKDLTTFAHLFYNEKEILLSHSGLPYFPKNLNIIPESQIIKGVGERFHNIDELFNKQSKNNQYQVHGHRNPRNLPIKIGRSFNLEGKVEFGGELRILRLNKKGFREISILSDF